MTITKEHFKLLSNKGKINHTFFGELDLVQDNTYIVFHKEEVGLDVPSDIAEFVSAMTINKIILWIGENHIILDFMINPDESDEILCVRMNDKLEVVSIDWES